MKISLSENIRTFRKQRKMTQAKLAEALGVTVGAVYKWESGQSQPELDLVVEMADFFDVSVDVLLGYRLKDNSLDSAWDRISDYLKTLDREALTEAEKMMGKYPHSFKAVYGCASVYLAFGACDRNLNQIRRALELLERSKMLLSQNDDPHISEASISGSMAMASFLLGKKEKSIELLKQNNVNGMFSSEIGTALSIWAAPEEAVPYLSEAFTSGISTLINVVFGFFFVFRSRGDWASAMDIIAWGVSLLTGIKMEAGQDALEKAHAEMLVLLSYAQARSGMQEDAAASLLKAREMAMHFDSMPDYSLKTVRFAEHQDRSVAIDIFGATASGSISELLKLLKDPQMTGQWREITENEQQHS